MKIILKFDREIDQALQEAEHTKKLPELNMVSKADVKAWFKEYERFWNNKPRLWKQTMKQYFEDEANEMYMEDVQYILGEIIDDINKSEKDANRNS